MWSEPIADTFQVRTKNHLLTSVAFLQTNATIEEWGTTCELLKESVTEVSLSKAIIFMNGFKLMQEGLSTTAYGTFVFELLPNVPFCKLTFLRQPSFKYLGFEAISSRPREVVHVIMSLSTVPMSIICVVV